MKVRVGFVVVVAVALLLSVVLIAPASSSAARAAVVTKDSGCMLYDGNGVLVSTTVSQSVVTSNGNGKMTCSARVAPPADGVAVRYNFKNTGVKCTTTMGDTATWHEVVSASGRATLQCTVH